MTDLMAFSFTVVGVLAVVLGILQLRHISLQGLVFGLTGTILGLLLGALASVPLSKLPAPFGFIMPVAVSILTTVIIVTLILSQRRAIMHLVRVLGWSVTGADEATTSDVSSGRILVDTSVIIDGRIADIAAAGFAPGVLVVPRFVLAELQNIADSDDAMRRGRGRRGLEVLNRLREMPGVTVEVTDEDVSGIREVDAKLVALAQRLNGHVLTTDYNLNQVAQIQGVRVLNVNELSNAIRPVVLPGEELVVRVVQPGKERHQGVGYLADGTMIVVENGDKLMGQEVVTEVTRVFQTVAGKMIFAAPRKTIGQGAPAEVPSVDNTEELPVPEVAEPIVKPAVHRQNRPRGRQHGSSAATAQTNVSAVDAPAHSGQPRPHGRRRGGSGAIEDRIIRQTQGDQAE